MPAQAEATVTYFITWCFRAQKFIVRSKKFALGHKQTAHSGAISRRNENNVFLRNANTTRKILSEEICSLYVYARVNMIMVL